jgi:NAD(P)H-dependent flavin oxidoreductase YrpB (nitropropane dioxygenase family)
MPTDTLPMARRSLDARALRAPVVVAPMFLVSGPELVIASCRAGLVGSFPTQNARTTEVLGADLAYMGTRFIACDESLAVDDYRKMLVRARISDVTAAAAVTGVLCSWLSESLDQVGLAPEELDTTGKVDISEPARRAQAVEEHLWGRPGCRPGRPHCLCGRGRRPGGRRVPDGSRPEGSLTGRLNYDRDIAA